MDAGKYELYQLKTGDEYKDIRFRPLRYLREHECSVTVDNYVTVFKGNVQDSENMKLLRERLEKELQANLCINVSDVIAVTKDGITAAYYVDPTKLILLPDFFHQPASGALITIDSENCPLDGRKGSWMTIDTLRLDGRNLFLMQSQDYGKDAPYVVADEQGRELATDRKGFTEECIEQIRKALKELELQQSTGIVRPSDGKPKLEVWQQYLENGEYLRAAEITEEQNYNMIDGRANNRAPKRSIIERLQEKQSEVQQGTPPGRMQELIQENEIERSRK